MLCRWVALAVSMCACSGAPAPVTAVSVTQVPVPDDRHGHRVEPVGDGWLAFGGFGDPWAADRGMRDTFWLGPGERTWQRRAGMQAPRAFFGSALLAGSPVAVGESVEVYDVAADCWREIVAAGLLPTSHFASAQLGSEVFVLGGYPLERSGFAAIDLTTGDVRSLPPPPGFEPGDHFHFLAALGGKLHCVGGLDVDDFTPQQRHCVWDQGAWTELPTAPPGLWAKFGGHAVIEGSWFLLGDFGAHCFDPVVGSWRALARPPQVSVMPAVVVQDGCLVVSGGMSVDGGTAATLVYDPRTDCWRVL